MFYSNKQRSLLENPHVSKIQAEDLRESWAEFFLNNVLPSLPVDLLKPYFSKKKGRPTKEIHAIVGAIILQQMFDLPDRRACQCYEFDLMWRHALNLESLSSQNEKISPRTLWEYRNILHKNGLYAEIFNVTTKALANKYQEDLDISLQRIDSVHIKSNMKNLGRHGLFTKTLLLFLRNLKKNHSVEFKKIDPELVSRYLDEEKKYNFFGKGRPSEMKKRLEAVAQDLYDLVKMFENNEKVMATKSYGYMVRVLNEQCQIITPEAETGGVIQVQLKEPKEIPSDSLQNPSDDEAAYSGHKGQGYQAQIMETCVDQREEENPEPALTLITHVKLEPANIFDGKAVMPAIEDAANKGLKPSTLLGDTLFGGKEYVDAAKKAGVDVISPVAGNDPELKKIRLAEFQINEKGLIAGCPEGQTAWATEQKSEASIVHVHFNQDICSNCPRSPQCPVKIDASGKAMLSYKPNDLWFSIRRAAETTSEFLELYSMRAGIESTNSQLDRLMRIKHLRYRGRKRVALAVHLKALGLNIWRAMSYEQKKRLKLSKIGLNFLFFLLFMFRLEKNFAKIFLLRKFSIKKLLFEVLVA